MKLFYIIAVLVVVVLALSPYVLLRTKPSTTDAIVFHDTYASRIRSIDPATCGDSASTAIQTYFYEGLYTYKYLVRPVTLRPMLAAHMPSISEDGLVYTIPLKTGVHFQRNACFGLDEDGRPKTREMTADDFVLAFKRVADFHIETQLAYAFIRKIKGVEDYRDRTRRYRAGDFSRYDELDLAGVKAIDDHTLQITLAERFPQFIYVLAMHNYAPIPREVLDYHLASEPDDEGGRRPVPIEDRTTDITQHEAAVGTGPYVLEEWQKASRIRLVRNPEYREVLYPDEASEEFREAGLLADAGQRVPFIDVRELRFVEETNPSWMLFENKRRDVASVPRDMYDSVIGLDKELTTQWQARGIDLKKYTSPAVYWIVFNCEDRVLGSSKSLRQALSLCYNVPLHIDVLHNGRGVPAKNCIPSSFPGWEEAGSSPYARLDLQLAREKIEDARKELVAKGVIQSGEEIPPLTIDIGDRGEYGRRLGQFMASQFREIGVELKVELQDWPTLQEKVHNKRSQMYTMGWVADYPDAENFLQLFYSPNIDHGTNNSNFSNPRFDVLFRKAAGTMALEDRIPLYVEMVNIISEDCPVLLLSEPVSFLLKYKWMHNIQPHPIRRGTGLYWRIDTDLRQKMGGRN